MSSLGAVIVGGYVNGLGLVRALSARGVRTAVVTTQPFDVAHRSRWVSDRDAVTGLEERPELLVELLERRARDWRGWAVLPTNDEAVAALAGAHERLSSLYRLISPPPPVARQLLDKELLADAARSVGAEVPHVYGPATATTAARDDLRFPVLVKPLAGYRFAARFGAKLFAARDREELRRCVTRVAAAGIPARVVDLVPGDDSCIYAHCTYVRENGEPTAGVTIRKLRQSPPSFGVARLAEISAMGPDLREVTVELLRRMGLHGIAVAEFKLDPRDGRPRFIEVNGRSVVYNALLRRAGLDLAALAWSERVLDRAESARPNGWPGVWVNLHADLLYSALRNEHLGVGGFIAPYRRSVLEAVWSSRDPLPFVAQWSGTAGHGAAARMRTLISRRGDARQAVPVGSGTARPARARLCAPSLGRHGH